MGIFHRHIYRDIAQDVSVSAEWTEIPVEYDMQIKKSIQEVTLKVAEARLNIDTNIALLPDKTVIDPEVQILDKNGKWHHLASGSFGVNHYDAESQTVAATGIGFRLGAHNMPRNTCFVAIRIRNDQPFKCSKIVWHSYDLK